MPKMKTVRGAAKRFKASKNRLKRGSAFRSHILTSHSVDSRDLSRVKLMLGKA